MSSRRRSRADAIVTFNLRDFPTDVLARYDIEAVHPDDFIHQQFGLGDSRVVIAARRCRSRLRAPAVAVERYLETLEGQGLPKTVAELRRHASVI